MLRCFCARELGRLERDYPNEERQGDYDDQQQQGTEKASHALTILPAGGVVKDSDRQPARREIPVGSSESLDTV
jgi:hypothetical protein